jgi:hypothetical protein
VPCSARRRYPVKWWLKVSELFVIDLPEGVWMPAGSVNDDLCRIMA